LETCSRNGQSGHSAGDCGYSNNINSFTDGSTTLTRYLEETVCEDMWFSVRAKQSGGGQGGS
jgi:formate dehydrogenase maturation protein FdhE